MSASRKSHEYQFGIEEEMFLASAGTGAAPRRDVTAFHEAAGKRFRTVERELMQCQVEISTAPSADFSEARTALASLRQGLAEVGREHGLKVFAAGTHPNAIWSTQKSTDKARYRTMMEDLQQVGRRSLVCGLHIHVEVPDPRKRVDLMNRLYPFLPVLLALSTSSPFWERHRTGLAGYRLRAYAELPRTGLPELFDDADDYDRYVKGMTRAGAVDDATFFWWHIRPSARYPTLELRVADSCTRLADTLTIAALYRCLVRLLDRRSDIHARLTGASRGFVTENFWRVERHGTRAEIIEETTARSVPLRKVVDRLIELVSEDAGALGCVDEVVHARSIVRHGSSADGQVAVYEAALKGGVRVQAALGKVVDWLAEETERAQ